VNALLQWFTSAEWTLTVKSLLHTLWQGAVIATLLGLTLRRMSNPINRHRCSLAALSGVLVMGLLTWAWLNRSEAVRQPVAPSAPVAAASQPGVTLVSDQPTVVMTVLRSEPKQGTPHWTHVRELFGHDRFEHAELVALMNDLYAREWSQFTNHFKPPFKLKKREKKEGKAKRVYEATPRTPYQRLLESADIPEATKAKL